MEKSLSNGWMDDLRFYVLYNSNSVISGRCLDDNAKAVCNGTPFMVEKISPRVRIELGPARSVGQRFNH